jgi:hypothetical protein
MPSVEVSETKGTSTSNDSRSCRSYGGQVSSSGVWSSNLAQSNGNPAVAFAKGNRGREWPVVAGNFSLEIFLGSVPKPGFAVAALHRILVMKVASWIYVRVNLTIVPNHRMTVGEVRQLPLDQTGRGWTVTGKVVKRPTTEPYRRDTVRPPSTRITWPVE